MVLEVVLSGAEEQEQGRQRQRAGRQSQQMLVDKVKGHGSHRLLRALHIHRRLPLTEHRRHRLHLHLPRSQLALKVGAADEAEDDLQRNRHG